jgi:hypothetical protein
MPAQALAVAATLLSFAPHDDDSPAENFGIQEHCAGELDVRQFCRDRSNWRHLPRNE